MFSSKKSSSLPTKASIQVAIISFALSHSQQSRLTFLRMASYAVCLRKKILPRCDDAKRKDCVILESLTD